MNLISCDSCGIVLDKDKLNFPEDIWDEETESADPTKCEWYGDDYVPIVLCPVCKNNIRENE